MPTSHRLALLGLLALQVLSYVRWDLDVVCDDGAFFFRYAEHLATGHGFRWNTSEPPVWGASAPLWPLLLAGGLRLGASVEAASAAVSMASMLWATACLGLVVLRLAGLRGALCLAPLLVFHHHAIAYAWCGLETPLTFALVATGAWILVADRGSLVVGVVAGLLAVHKVDLVPLACVLVGTQVRGGRRDLLRAGGTAAAIAACWYGFAWWHFGSPVPNSVRTKIHHAGTLPRSWFATELFLGRGTWLVTLLALVGAWCLRPRAKLASFLAAAVLVPLVAFTVFTPSEPFDWYLGPAVPGMLLAAAVGGALVVDAATRRLPAAQGAGLAFALVVLLGASVERLEREHTSDWRRFLAEYETTRTAMGRWLDEHLPPDARVLAFHGNVAHYSHRFVYDGTYLNRAPDEDLRTSLLEVHRPEVVAVFPSGALVPLDSLDAPTGYVLGPTWTEHVLANPNAFYGATYVREDVAVDVVPGPILLEEWDRRLEDLEGAYLAVLALVAPGADGARGRVAPGALGAEDGGPALTHEGRPFSAIPELLLVGAFDDLVELRVRMVAASGLDLEGYEPSIDACAGRTRRAALRSICRALADALEADDGELGPETREALRSRLVREGAEVAAFLRASREAFRHAMEP